MSTGWWTISKDNYFECLEQAPEGDLFRFLHGYCTVFAEALRDKRGYRILGAFVYDEEIEAQKLVHAFCETPDGQFADVRGITDDWTAFMEAFEDECDPDDVNVDDLSEGYRFPDKYMYEMAVSAIDGNPEYY